MNDEVRGCAEDGFVTARCRHEVKSMMNGLSSYH